MGAADTVSRLTRQNEHTKLLPEQTQAGSGVMNRAHPPDVVGWAPTCSFLGFIQQRHGNHGSSPRRVSLSLAFLIHPYSYSSLRHVDQLRYAHLWKQGRGQPPDRGAAQAQSNRLILRTWHLPSSPSRRCSNKPAPSTTVTASSTRRTIPTPKTGTTPGTSGPRSRPRMLASRLRHRDIPRTSETRALAAPSPFRQRRPSPIPRSLLGARRRTRQGPGRGRTVLFTMTRIEASSMSYTTTPRSPRRRDQDSRASPRQLMSPGLRASSCRLASHAFGFRCWRISMLGRALPTS